jgi:cytochrome c556
MALAMAAMTTMTAAGAVLAHDGATGVVKDRMDAMESMGKAMKTVAGMMEAGDDYDADKVRDAARTIAGHGGDALTKLFPEGSTEKPSRALPAIWSEWPRFQDLAAQLVTYAKALEEAADNGPFGPGMGYGMGYGQGMGPRAGQGMMQNGEPYQGRGQGMGPGMMQGQGPMMGGGYGRGYGPGGMMNDPETLAQMPAHASFMRLAQTCRGCHTEFRSKKK